VADKNIRDRISYALKRSKPFRNFKYEVDYNEEVRQQWFQFKEQRYIDYVKTYLSWKMDKEE
jgi:hypothetical protein